MALTRGREEPLMGGIVLICYAIATLTYETVPALSENARQFLWISEVVVTALFTLEYGVSVISRNEERLSLQFLRHH